MEWQKFEWSKGMPVQKNKKKGQKTVGYKHRMVPLEKYSVNIIFLFIFCFLQTEKVHVVFWKACRFLRSIQGLQAITASFAIKLLQSKERGSE